MDNSTNRIKKTALITGAGKGIGFELVKQFLNKDYKVIAVSRNVQPLLKLDNPALLSLSVDLSKTGEIEKMIPKLQEYTAIDVLINNAGHLVNKPFIKITPEEVQNSMAVNFTAPFFTIQKLMPLLRTAHVINISSIGGVQGSLKFAGLSAYSTAKAALICLTEMLSEEFKNEDIVFNCVALGSVDTEMFQQAFPGAKASMTVGQVAKFLVNFAETAPAVMRGKIIPVSVDNP